MVLSFLGLIFFFGYAFSPAPARPQPALVGFAVFIMIIEAFVAMIQAYIFTLSPAVHQRLGPPGALIGERASCGGDGLSSLAARPTNPGPRPHSQFKPTAALLEFRRASRSSKTAGPLVGPSRDSSPNELRKPEP